MCSCEWNEAEVGVSSCTMNGGSDVKGKSWKKLHEERKALRKERKQERLLKNLASWERQNDSNRKEVGSTSPEQAPRKTPSTVSIAVPGSILENAQSPELRSYVAGQIARAACIFRVDEVVVFDDVGVGNVHDVQGVQAAEVERTLHSSCLQLARILQYLECPQYLRKSFFPMHNDLKYSGLLNPLDAPHHLRQQNSFQYREGVVIEKAAKAGRSYVNAGLLHDVLIDRALQPGIRVTLKLDSPDQGNTKKPRGTVVAPNEPRKDLGVYWGYTIRIAHSLLEVFSKSPYPGGYDVSIGTSDTGSSIYDYSSKSIEFEHLLVVFGGLQGLEEALANEEKLLVSDPKLLFDHYVNTLPRQGSRTIRTEEAILIAMTALQDKLQPKTPEVLETLCPNALASSKDTGLKSGKRLKLSSETLTDAKKAEKTL